ncbi:MAG: SH3 domain-containing protein [Lachnospiraceae bacterium]|nr:SH3 domain-containing protein [Lachnospiraceae bacterium]
MINNERRRSIGRPVQNNKKIRMSILWASMALLAVLVIVACFSIENKETTQTMQDTVQQETQDAEQEAAQPETQDAVQTASQQETQDAEQTASQPETQDAEQDEEYLNFAIADVDDYVNVRSKPTTESEIVGKIYDGAVAEILETAGDNGDWFQIVSGNVEGYIKAEFFIYGEAAAEVMDQYVTRYAEVKADRLNIREDKSTESARIGYIDRGQRVIVSEDLGDWLRVKYAGGKEGYISAEYVTVSEEYSYAKTIEEEEKETEEQRRIEAQNNIATEAVPEEILQVEFPETTYTSNEELRKAVVDYAMQYVGNKYVSGGTSLATGTDCSGFTCFVYADFGISISRTPAGQHTTAGRSISYSEIQPGDIICYQSAGKTKCSHVALYIGNGQIVHAANSRKGVIVGAADYDNIIDIKNVID